MEHFFLTLFQTHFEVFKNFGYLIVFSVSLFESVPLLGMILPGQTIVILAGFLVKLELFNFWSVVLLAAFGAILGDLAGFLLGRKYGHHFTLAEKKFFIKREHFEKIKGLIEKNAFKSIFFGRLHSFSRTLTPFVSGASGIKLSKFLSIEILSALTWAFVSVLIGFIFGKSFEKASFFIGQLILVGTLIAIAVILLTTYAKKKSIKIEKVHMYFFILGLVSIYLFSVIAKDLDSGRFFSILDNRVYVLKEMIRTPVLDSFMLFFNLISNYFFRIFFVGLLFLFLLYKRYVKKALLLIVAIGSGYVLVDMLKAYFSRVRPVGLLEVAGSSFPSGHATISMLFAVIFVYVYVRHIQNSVLRNAVQIFAFSIACFIGISRVYFGVHYVSDVLAGFLFGIFLASFWIIVFSLEKFIIRSIKKKHELPLP